MVMGKEDGNFSSLSSTAGQVPMQLEKADFDHDGKLDLAVISVGAGSPYGQRLYVMRGSGDGYFYSPYTIVADTTDAAARFAVGDFNGDSWADLAFLEPGSARVRVAINAASPTLAFAELAAPIAVGAGGRTIESGALNGDSRDDLIVVRSLGPAQGAAEVFLSQAGGFAAGGSAALPLDPVCSVLAAISKDSALDLAVGGATATGGAVCVVTGDGTGNLSSAVAASLTAPPASIDAGDLNGDGTGDIVAVQTEASALVSVLVYDGEAPPVRFIRGDANDDAGVDISDAVKALRFLFAAAPTDCAEALDANDDGVIDIGDPIYLLGYLFAHGAAMPAPFPAAGSVPADQSLGCERK